MEGLALEHVRVNIQQQKGDFLFHTSEFCFLDLVVTMAEEVICPEAGGR
jgi:hypothetical protein